MKKNLLVLLYYNFFILCYLFGVIYGDSRKEERSSPQIAIIGGGVGGCSLAYFLKDLLGHNSNVVIDLYEKSGQLGGRLDTVEMFGRHYETGGSIIHPRNKYAVDLVKKLGLHQKEKEPASGFSLLKDHKVVFTSSTWKVVTILRILYRYGLDFNYIHSFTNKLIDDFSKIYDHQLQKINFEHPFELLASMSPMVANLTGSSFRSFLQSYGLKDIFINELVDAITFVNYGQSADIHSLVGSIAMAGADEGLFSIENGNKQLPIALAKASKVKLFLNSSVQGIVDHQNGSYGISITSTSQQKDEDNRGEILKNYDLVIIANPLEVSKIKFDNFSKIPYDVNQRRYHRTVATIVAGQLNENFTLSQQKIDSAFTCNPFTFFTTIGRIYPVDSKPETSKNVYKIFSPKPLTENQLKIVFSEIYQIKVMDWLAYPHYDTLGSDNLPSFILDGRNLYYVNAIEWAASAIEMSLVSAKNIALLISQRIESQNIGNYQSYVGTQSKPNVEATQKIEL